MTHPLAFAKASEATKAVLEAFKPPDERNHRKYDHYANIPQGTVTSILEEAATGHSKAPGGFERARRLHDMLGARADRIPRDVTPPRNADRRKEEDQ
jgi:hypothetical protein